ncbi:MAG: VCBS repeat-containing protein [Actinomycetota bacterium]|nr:VCBS repeat-containing protein [Actinomycetota bacterium]
MLAEPLSPPPRLLRLPTPTGAGGFGGAVAGVDDVDGDGMSDVVVAAPGSKHVYVISGSGGNIVRDIRPPSATGRTFGAAVAAVGDVDLDGTKDFAVGAPSDGTAVAEPAGGRVFVFSGASGALLRELVPRTGDGSDFGRSVSGPGDVSGDGVPDVVVGAPAGQGGGSVFAFSGANGAQLWSRAESVTSFGQVVVATPDVSSDGVADVLVSSVSLGSGRQRSASAGLVTDLLVGVLNGVLSGVVPERVQVLSGTTGTVVRSISDPAPHQDDAFGGAVAPVGDQDGDGVVDHLIAERGANQLHLYSGNDGVLIRSFAPPPNAHGQAISALVRVDDQDGDGRDDIWVGIGSARSAYLLNGAGTVLMEAAAPSPGGSFGTSIATMGKTSGEAASDVVVGDPTERDGGAAYLVRTSARALTAAATNRAAACEGAGCQALLPTRGQTATPTTTSTSTVPATATLPKPSNTTSEGTGLPSTGAPDWLVAGLWAMALGMAGIMVLGRARHVVPDPETAGCPRG